jgi:hypothetical protein
MKISGFTFLRNAHKLYYPIKESILSILDLVDEFVIALGEGDDDDTSLEIIQNINSSKIKIVYTKWDLEKYQNGSEYAHQTDIAKENCTGDWLFYLQGDEVIHENDLTEIKTVCQKYWKNPKIEGFVFNYLHFFGDYNHYFSDHCWYKNEIRIIRNSQEIHSWRDAQSFKYVLNPNRFDYHKSDFTRKLNCIRLQARVFHYGWVRPPEVMKTKHDQSINIYNLGKVNTQINKFDYCRMDYCKVFTKSHPAIMSETIKKLYWKNDLRFNGPIAINRPISKHEKLKYRVISWVEENLLGGYVIGGFKNYKILN